MRSLTTLICLLFSCLCTAASRPPAISDQSMVVTAQHLATKVGVDVLKAGGNAVDAAVAIGYALAVTHPCCGNIGGGGFMLIRLANGQTHFINFREKAPLAATYDAFKKNQSSYRGVGAPGTVRGLNLALKKYGTLPFNKVIAPAIKLANEGFKLTAGDSMFLQKSADSFLKQKNVATIFTNDGQAYQTGDTLTQKNLAYTLQLIAKKGNDVFYNGAIADKIAAASKKNNGLLTKKDLQQYNVEELSPIVCNYRGYEIITAPPPSAGGITLCEMLNITEGYPIKDWGYRSAKSTHYTVEAMRYAFADRNTKLGDPNFVNNPTDKLISKEYATYIRKKIKDNTAAESATIGTVTPIKEGQNTTAYIVVDRKKNCVAVTFSLNSFFGARVIASDTGFFLNNHLYDFTLEPNKPNAFGLIQGQQNIIEPGKRPLSSMAPTIIAKDGKLFMAITTSGGSSIPTILLLAIQNVIDFHMDIQHAVDAPRFHMQWLPDVIFIEPRTLSPDTLKILVNMGHTFQHSSAHGDDYWGALAGILVDPKTGKITGAVDSRRPAGLALGE